ncbi:MAG: hypothetical protein ACREFH_10150 [Stellaceae bacterium]
MVLDLAAAAGVVPLTALILGACVSQSAGSEEAARIRQLQARQGAPCNLAHPSRPKRPGAARA